MATAMSTRKLSNIPGMFTPESLRPVTTSDLVRQPPLTGAATRLSYGNTITIYGGSGCHNFTLADIDGDGKQDVVCSSAVILGDAQNFIMYQNNYNDWSYVAGPGQIGGDVTLISVSGSRRNNVVGSAIDGSGVVLVQISR